MLSDGKYRFSPFSSNLENISRFFVSQIHNKINIYGTHEAVLGM